MLEMLQREQKRRPLLTLLLRLPMKHIRKLRMTKSALYSMVSRDHLLTQTWLSKLIIRRVLPTSVITPISVNIGTAQREVESSEPTEMTWTHATSLEILNAQRKNLQHTMPEK